MRDERYNAQAVPQFIGVLGTRRILSHSGCTSHWSGGSPAKAGRALENVEQIKKNDDGDGDAEQPQNNTAHENDSFQGGLRRPASSGSVEVESAEIQVTC